MKKKICTVVLLVLSFSLFALAKTETVSNDVSLAVMQGPTGFSSAGLPQWINTEVYPSPVEAVSNLVNGTLDMAVIPANKAATLFNNGMDIKIIAIVGEGMLSVVGTDPNSSTLSVPGAGDTPDLMASLLFGEYERDYSVAAPAQIAQLLIAGKSKLAIIPQPFVNKVLMTNPNAKIVWDVNERWKDYSGLDQYPMSVLVASSKFVEENKATVKRVANAYRQSVKWVLENPESAGVIIEEKGIMAKDMAAVSIKDCQLVYRDGEEAKNELKTYFDTVLGNVSDDLFFF